MPERFALACLLLHALLVPLTIAWARRWRSAAPLGPALWALRLAADAAVLAVLGAALCGLAAMAVSNSQFTLLRFLCQGLFGEGVLFAGLVGTWHLRSGQAARGAVPLGAGLLLLAIYADAYHREPRLLCVEQHQVELPQAGLGVLRIAHLSDLQTPQIGGHEARALRAVLDLKPDLIVMTGDYIQERLEPTGPRAAFDLRGLLQRLRFDAPLGVFAVQGDVEEPGWPALFAGTRVVPLQDETRVIPLPDGRRLFLAGLSVRRSRARRVDDIARMLQGAGPDDLRVVIGHAPDFADVLGGGPRVDLALAGHTHGGQIVLPLLGPLRINSRLPTLYAGGLHDLGGVPLHVSRGVGMERMTAPQVRFLCPPEVCLVELGPGPAARAAGAPRCVRRPPA